MKSDDSIPLARQDADPLIQALLRAGRSERAPERSEERLLTTLGLGSAGVAGSTGALATIVRFATRFGSKGVSSPLIAIGGVIAAAAIGAAVASSTSSSPRAPAPENPVTEPVVTAVAAAAPPVADLPTTRIEDLPSAPVLETVKPALAAKTSPVPAPAAGPSLAREVELVEAARAALARGDVSTALSSLDAHDRELPSGALMPEARVLRIEALVRAGGARNLERANALGDAFLADNPSGPQARRVRAVLDRAR